MAYKLRLLATIAAAMLSGCWHDYGIVTGKTETIIETETVVVTETVTETEVVEVPVYIEVEVPVYIDTGFDDPGLIWVDSFVQPNTVDGIDILWVIDTSGSMYRYDPQLMAGIEIMLSALPPTSWRLAMMSNDPSRAVLENQFPQTKNMAKNCPIIAIHLMYIRLLSKMVFEKDFKRSDILRGNIKCLNLQLLENVVV